MSITRDIAMPPTIDTIFTSAFCRFCATVFQTAASERDSMNKQIIMKIPIIICKTKLILELCVRAVLAGGGKQQYLL